MADTTELYKMNVRSPYYVVVTEEGKPDSIAADFSQDDDTPEDDENLPDEPVEFVIPDIGTQDVVCGETVNVSSDIGVRKYALKGSEDLNGDFTVTYRVNKPIKISSSNPQTDTGVAISYSHNFGRYVGDVQHKLALENAIAASQNIYTQHLTDGEATGTFTHTKSTGTGKVTWTVNAPIENDDYSLTFGCPASDDIPVGSRTLPATPPANNEIVMNVLAFWWMDNTNIDSGGNDTYPDRNLALEINGVSVVDSMNLNQVYIISDQSQLGNIRWQHPFISSGDGNPVRTTNYISRGTNLKAGTNDVRLKANGWMAGRVEIARLGIYHDGTEYKFTNVDDAASYSFTKAYKGDNSYKFFGRVAFSKLYTRVGNTYTHNEVRIDWFEPSDGTHAYVRNEVAQFPWFYNEALREQERNSSYTRYKTSGSTEDIQLDTYSGGVNYFRFGER